MKGWELDQFYFALSLRGSGAAMDLIAAAEIEMAARGVTLAHLKCAVGNDRAHRFHCRAGRTDRGPRPPPSTPPRGR